MHSLGSYTLIITEKPDAAKRIALALDSSGKPERKMQNGVPYYEVNRDGKIVVVPAFGHLYTVFASARGKYPVFDYEWVPMYKAKRKDSRTRVWLQSIERLAEEASMFIDACDYDIEGSIIGYCILKYACKGREQTAKRMKYSTLTKEELEKAYAEPLPHLDFALIAAGLARHEVDWLYGVNLSRALTVAAKKASGRYEPLSTGRVQGPTLRFLEAREKSIQTFVPTPYWTLSTKVKLKSKMFWAEHERQAFKVREEADAALAACKGKSGLVAAVKAEKQKVPPPPPFDLGSLQFEAYRVFGFTPMRTASLAQRLYLEALISYPRTSSQKLPPTIGYQTILKSLSKASYFAGLTCELLTRKRLKPREGTKTDPAHPAIYPTGKLSNKLTKAEANLWSLVVSRFLAVFAEAAVQETTKVTLNIGEEQFLLGGKRLLKKGWIQFYQPFVALEDELLPPVQEGDVVTVERVALKEKSTKPPSRYNSISLLRKMEESNIGTKATRAGIIQTLYDRKYIQGEKIAVTQLGCKVVDVLGTFCPSVVSVEFTRRLEEQMARVQGGQETKEEILREVVEALKPVLAGLKEHEEAVGKQLSNAVQETKLEELVSACPTCGDGKLLVIHSKKTGKRFVGCTNFFKNTCKTAFPLPQRGAVKLSGKTCRTCRSPVVLVWMSGKRPWTLCLNPKCQTKNKQGKHSFSKI
jgi:DNA topoisomerase-1